MAVSCVFYMTGTWKPHDIAICMQYGIHMGAIRGYWCGLHPTPHMYFAWLNHNLPGGYHMACIWLSCGVHVPVICHMTAVCMLYSIRVGAICGYSCGRHATAHIYFRWLNHIAPIWMLYSIIWLCHVDSICPPHGHHMTQPYGIHVRIIWFSHMKYIWGVGCKPY